MASGLVSFQKLDLPLQEWLHRAAQIFAALRRMSPRNREQPASLTLKPVLEV